MCHSFTTILLVATLAACGTPSPASPPPASADPGPTPTQTSVGLPSPTPDCPRIDELGVPAPDIELHAYGGFQPLYLAVVALRDSTGQQVPMAIPTLALQDLGRLPGGVRITGSLVGDADEPPASADVSVAASLAIGGGSFQPHEVTFDGGQLALTLPNVDTAARLEVRLSVHDDCFDAESIATASLQIGSQATVAACAMDPEEGIAPYLDELVEQPILVDRIAILAALSSAEPVWGIGVASSDYGTRFPGWDRDVIPVTGSPGSRVEVKVADGDLALASFPTTFYQLADVLREFEAGFEPEPVVTRDPNQLDDGSFSLRLPEAPGRYVTLTPFAWRSPCVVGNSIANFLVEVR